jgi:ABC-2 type transport system permease protein
MDLKDMSFLKYFYFLPLVLLVAMGTVMMVLNVEDRSSLGLSMTVCLISIGAYFGVPKALDDIEEKGFIKTYGAGGIPFWSFPLVNIVISLIHIMVTSIVILIAAPIVFAGKWPQSIPLYLFSIIITALASLSYSTLLVNLIKSKVILKAVGFLLVILTALYEGVIFAPTFMPKIIQALCEVLPFTHGIRLMANTGSTFGSFLILLVMTTGALIASYILSSRANK